VGYISCPCSDREKSGETESLSPSNPQSDAIGSLSGPQFGFLLVHICGGTVVLKEYLILNR